MIKIIEVKEGVKLQDYDLYSSLAIELREMYKEAYTLIPKIKGKKVWMVNSTVHGGGVAEMMPRLISLLRQLGIECEWVVASTGRKEFYTLTKKIHNLIHGEGIPFFTPDEKTLYEAVNKENAEMLLTLMKPGDILVIHDPQPMAMAHFIRQNTDIRAIWRCHIGLNRHKLQTEAAWGFLRPYTEAFQLSIFSAAEYIPDFLHEKSTLMYPSVDPLDHKNRDLPLHKVVGILCNANIITEYHPVLTPPFAEAAKRLQPDGSFQSPLLPSESGMLFKPMILQISRWDRFKGFLPLMKGFEILKSDSSRDHETTERNRRRLQLVELVLAGPDPDYVDDDPQGREVLREICQYYLSMPLPIQRHITILKLPMSSRKQNELIVNALQRVATVVVQNSLLEGFGLTVTEALWKIKPVIGTTACGIRQQIRENIDGSLISDPEDPQEIARKINYALSNPRERDAWAYSGQKRVIERFLIFSQIRHWLQIFASGTLK